MEYHEWRIREVAMQRMIVVRFEIVFLRLKKTGQALTEETVTKPTLI
jgi:hypothetical protein